MNRSDSAPFFSIITVVRNNAWLFSKTARSLYCQNHKNFEYIVWDGNSTDGTFALAQFCKVHGIADTIYSESDSGVYQAMNKSLAKADGHYICFLNAGDVFASDNVLTKVQELLADGKYDGILGWGRLADNAWASWAETEGFKLASLGFCHQALFVKRDLLLSSCFDERPFKTDSDTLQLGRLYARGANIPIVPDVLAVRGAEHGISSDLKRSKISIRDTLIEEYPSLTSEDADKLIDFRRRCDNLDDIRNQLRKAPEPLRQHAAIMVLDTLMLRQSAIISEEEADALFVDSFSALRSSLGHNADSLIQRYFTANEMRVRMLNQAADEQQTLQGRNATFLLQEEKRLGTLLNTRKRARHADVAFVISMTSFPARLPTLSAVINSLLEQTVSPTEIHLWLGRNEVPSKSWLPQRLLALEKHGLQIHFCETTRHQYDKYLHNFELNTHQPFIIVDDDVIYPETALQSLLEAHRVFPNAVVANRCHLMAIDANGGIDKYKKWHREAQSPRPSLLLCPTGAGGVLYPPGFLTSSEATDLNLILRHAPFADDIWLKTCALASGVPTVSTSLSTQSKWYLRYTPTMESGALYATNSGRGLNDLQITSCMEWLATQRPQIRAELLAEASFK
jgi:hypothetical protein